MDYVDNPEVQNVFMQVKRERKEILAAWVKENLGIEVNVDSIFDCQSRDYMPISVSC